MAALAPHLAGDLSPDHDALRRALLSTGTIVAAVRPEQWSAPSPCAGWTVRQVCNNLVGGLRLFAAQLTGEEPESADHDGHDWLGEDPARRYHDAARADMEAWLRPDSRDAVLELAFGAVPAPQALVVHLTEIVVHGIDVAVALDLEDLVDQDAAAALLRTMRTMGTDAFRQPGIFGPERPARADDPSHRRLLAYLGRDIRDPLAT